MKNIETAIFVTCVVVCLNSCGYGYKPRECLSEEISKERPITTKIRYRKSPLYNEITKPGDFFYNAILSEDISTVRNCINIGTDINDPHVIKFREYERTITSLDIAVITGNVEIVQLLLNSGAISPNQVFDQSELFRDAVITNNTNLVRLILDRIKIDKNTLTHCLDLTIDQDNLDLLKLLISFGAVIKKGHYGFDNEPSIVTKAIENNNIVILDYLITNFKENIDINYEFDYVCNLGNLQVFDKMIKEGANVNYSKTDPVIVGATQYGHYNIVKKLIELGATIDQRGRKGTSREGPTALEIAVDNENYCIAKLLLENGANPNNQGKEDPALIKAAFNSNLEITKLLLHYKANPNIINKEGYTPLHAAVNSNSYEIVQYLLLKGANRNITDNFHKTPLDYARGNNFVNCIKILE